MEKKPMKVQEVESEDWELSVYPTSDKTYAGAQKYMTYESISTGAKGKNA
jgi:hypothetical protein